VLGGGAWRRAAILAFGVLFGSCALVPLMGNNFVAPEDRGQFNIDIELPAGMRLEETARLSLAAEQELLEDPEFVTLYSRAGSRGAATSSAGARWRCPRPSVPAPRTTSRLPCAP
jgi:multidrug efflux pump subunit AcrB